MNYPTSLAVGKISSSKKVHRRNGSSKQKKVVRVTVRGEWPLYLPSMSKVAYQKWTLQLPAGAKLSDRRHCVRHPPKSHWATEKWAPSASIASPSSKASSKPAWLKRLSSYTSCDDTPSLFDTSAVSLNPTLHLTSSCPLQSKRIDSTPEVYSKRSEHRLPKKPRIAQASQARPHSTSPPLRLTLSHVDSLDRKPDLPQRHSHPLQLRRCNKWPGTSNLEICPQTSARRLVDFAQLQTPLHARHEPSSSIRPFQCPHASAFEEEIGTRKPDGSKGRRMVTAQREDHHGAL